MYDKKNKNFVYEYKSAVPLLEDPKLYVPEFLPIRND